MKAKPKNLSGSIRLAIRWAGSTKASELATAQELAPLADKTKGWVKGSEAGFLVAES